MPFVLRPQIDQMQKEIEASVLMQRLSYQTENVLSNKTTRNRIVLSWQFPSVRGSNCNIRPHGQDGAAVAKKTRTRGKEATTVSTIGGLRKFEFLGRVFMSIKNYFRMYMANCQSSITCLKSFS